MKNLTVTFSALVLIFICCTFEADKEPLTIELINPTAEMISPWPDFTFVFSQPLVDSTIELIFSPDLGTIYHTYLNSSKDTLVCHVSGILDGETEYTIAPVSHLIAENGMILSITDAQFSFTTYPVEQPPNSTKGTADTLANRCFGTIAPKNDTDFFFIEEYGNFTIQLLSHASKAGFIITDAQDSIIAKDNNLSVTKEVPITSDCIAPFICKIYALIDNDTRYELVINR